MTADKPYGMRLESGALIPAAVEQAAQKLSLAFCDISGFGELEWADLALPSEERVIHFEGPLQLVDFKGRLRSAGGVVLSDFVCTLARNTDNGIQLLGGALKRACVKFAEISLVPLETPSNGVSSAVSDSQPEAKAPIAPASPPISRQPAPRQKPAAVELERDLGKPMEDRWKKAVEESNRVAQIARDSGFGEETDDVRPNVGDIVNHQQFGKCAVLRVGDDHITLRKPDRRVVELGLPILKFVRVSEEDGHTVFKVEVRARR